MWRQAALDGFLVRCGGFGTRAAGVAAARARRAGFGRARPQGRLPQRGGGRGQVVETAAFGVEAGFARGGVLDGDGGCGGQVGGHGRWVAVGGRVGWWWCCGGCCRCRCRRLLLVLLLDETGERGVGDCGRRAWGWGRGGRSVGVCGNVGRDRVERGRGSGGGEGAREAGGWMGGVGEKGGE